jgi:hypothetical protein
MSQITKNNIKELQKQTLINILSVKGIIYTHYKNKKKGNHVHYRLSKPKN